MSSPYRTIVADPPWHLSGGRGSGAYGPADVHYPTMSPAAVAALAVEDLASEAGCHLWLWAIDPVLPEALDVLRTWGFRYVRTLVWGKVADDGRVAFGQGQYLRTAHEVCLFGVRGPAHLARREDGSRVAERSLLLAPRGAHSAKPETFRAVVEAVSAPPRIELFHRGTPPAGWDAWGDECGTPGIALGVRRRP